MLKLSERLYSLRKERKLTQDSVAKELGISMKSYCRYEKNEREPTASLLVEMLATTGRRLSELYQEIVERCGSFEMAERGYRFSQEEKGRINKLLMEDKQLPDFGLDVEKVSYADGCKVYFKDGGWVTARFSGTEPLLRVFCEMDTAERAGEMAARMERFLGLDSRNLE